MSTTHPDPEMVQQRLEVELEIRPPESCSCGVGDIDGDIVDLQQVRVDDRHYTDLVVSSEECCSDDQDGCVMHRKTEIASDCPFGAFYDEGWVPRVVGIPEDTVQIRAYLPDREALATIIEILEQTAEEFHIRKLRRIEHDRLDADAEQITFDLNGLTKKQRTAAVRAVETGYYEKPREISLESLASEMDISKSALSQRLNAVEAKFMTNAFAGENCEEPSVV